MDTSFQHRCPALQGVSVLEADEEDLPLAGLSSSLRSLHVHIYLDENADECLRDAMGDVDTAASVSFQAACN
eukprot:gene25549-11194_t